MGWGKGGGRPQHLACVHARMCAYVHVHAAPARPCGIHLADSRDDHRSIRYGYLDNRGWDRAARVHHVHCEGRKGGREVQEVTWGASTRFTERSIPPGSSRGWEWPQWPRFISACGGGGGRVSLERAGVGGDRISSASPQDPLGSRRSLRTPPWIACSRKGRGSSLPKRTAARRAQHHRWGGAASPLRHRSRVGRQATLGSCTGCGRA